MLEVTDKEIFLLSDGIVGDKRQFNTTDLNAYDTSSIRAYLKGDYMTTFSKEERLAISLKNVLTDIGYNGLGTAIPDDSGDSAFLLSVAEAMNPAYFPRGDDDRILEADWWLRSAGTWGYRAAIVLIAYGGGIEFPGFDVTQSYAIRPAFKLHLPL